MRMNEGFKEANIAHDLSGTFRSAGFLAYPEFPYGSGSIDAVFVKEREIVVCEWKRLYPRSIPRIAEQTKRLMRFDAATEMAKHRFIAREWRVSRLWVCDTWLPSCADWWGGKLSKVQAVRPFDQNWKCGRHDFDSFGDGWYSYSWVWAFSEPTH